MKSQVMISQIRELHKNGHAIRKIAKALGISRNTVRRHLSQGGDTLGEPQDSRPKTSWIAQFDWSRALSEICSGVTIVQVYKENLPPVSYKRFCYLVRQKRNVKPKPACRIPHEPGEKTFVDFCDGILITSRKSGRKSKTHLFLGVLPFSSRTFGIFVEDQKLPNFLRCHEKMWAYFGGVTPYVVIDNLKSGVKKAHLYDPEENPTYCDYGNQTGFAVLPARPYTPRDKALVECGIGVVQKTFFQEVRNEIFYSVDELNRRWFRFLDPFNNQIMKDHGVSRNDRFQNEKDRLLPLPEASYEIAEWKSPKVHPDCCVQVDKCFYSVPFQYCGQTVKAKITDKLITIYSQTSEQIATHLRAKRYGSVLIDEKHLPPWAMQNSKFEVKKCLAMAEMIGPKTLALLEEWFGGTHPLRYLRRAQGLCRLQKDGFSREALEYAAAQAITFRKHRLGYIKACAQAYATRPRRKLESLPNRDSGSIHLHRRK
jgi:transposase